MHVATGGAGGSLKPLSRQATAIPVHRHLVRTTFVHEHMILAASFSADNISGDPALHLHVRSTPGIWFQHAVGFPGTRGEPGAGEQLVR
jgi:hypothetical protein